MELREKLSSYQDAIGKPPLYSPLNAKENEIRLITILPGQHWDKIECYLRTFSLERVDLAYQTFVASKGHKSLRDPAALERWTEHQLPSSLAKLKPLERVHSTQPSRELHRFIWGDFVALSYVWGDKDNTREIVVNKHKMQVTASLEQVLRGFRSAGKFSGRCRIWVDALSINQADLEERAAQVQRMSDIYGVAWTVVADMGAASARSTAALSLVQDFATFRELSCEGEIEGLLRADPRALGTMNWLGLHELMQRPYWFRLWIIQELVMGGSRVWIRCGDAVLDWSTFCTGIGVLQEHLWLVKDQCLFNEVTAAAGNVASAWSTGSLHLVYRDLSHLNRRTASEKARKLSLGRLLDLACRSDASDPRDKVYALIGLMPLAAANLLQPDYTLPTAEVYTRATKAFMQALENLDSLREANPWGPTGCPSWVADWLWEGRALAWSGRIDAPVWGPAYLFPWRTDNSNYAPYNASRDSNPSAKFLTENLLRCRGFIIDTISGLSAREVTYFSWDTSSIHSPDHFKSAYGSHENTAEAISRTLIADRDAYGQKANARHTAILRLPSTFALAEPQFQARGWPWLAGQQGYYFRWSGFRNNNRSFRLGDTFFEDYFAEDIAADAEEIDVSGVYTCFDRSSQRRRFMTTTGGHVGWAPDNMHGGHDERTRVGDLIVILLGCSTPLAIRPCGEYYQVLGEAYVHGMMDSEAMDDLDRGKYKLEKFTFC
ncbi:heterokaryon incompatibility protein-domain-containing protein [Paraphoma chrysanthemicola]|uniref:Heterokaryon incompatibility protein-domain-containing protein n=1 Tax=Paraphoma chrysanthemicola TaxID=798071 RepID=A0A8K0W2T3_9PLEO|nr:heterokaryon incompatibility protein-domain-containing protein [Paraphoma chrysanthemicola]